MMGQKYYKGEGGQKYTKYNKINNNSENFRDQDYFYNYFGPLLQVKVFKQHICCLQEWNVRFWPDFISQCHLGS